MSLEEDNEKSKLALYRSEIHLGGFLDADLNGFPDKEFNEVINDIRKQVIDSPFSELKLPADMSIDYIGSCVVSDLHYKLCNDVKVPYKWVRNLLTLDFVIKSDLVPKIHWFNLALNLGNFELAKTLFNDTYYLYDTNVTALTKFEFLQTCRDRTNEEWLVWAAQNGHLAIVEKLIERGVNINIDDHSDNDYATALQYAAGNGHASVVQLMIDNGADIHSSSEFAFRKAAQYGHLPVVEVLFKHGANIRALNDAALDFAAENGHLHVVQFLIKNGVDIRSIDRHALQSAAAKGHLHVMEFLIKHGANVHAEDDSVLTIPAKKGHLDVVMYLTDNFTFHVNTLKSIKSKNVEIRKIIDRLIEQP